MPSRALVAGRYRLADRIGEGGMGTVWRAWDTRERRWVAAKVLGRYDGTLLLRFAREQSVRIRHPHVVAPATWAADDSCAVLTMDLVAGGSLETLLDGHGPLPTSYVAVLLDQVLDALAAVHAAGLVHRDLKPANLLLEATGRERPWLRLSDFGVAAPVEDVRLTRVPGGVGTDGYAAPEQLRGERPDPRADLFSAGVVALQALTGRLPRPPYAVPDGPLSPLLAALLAEEPADRPATALAARAWLRRIGVPTGCPWRDEPRPPYVGERLGRRREPASPTLAWTSVLLTLAICAVALVLR